MSISPLEYADIPLLKELQPPDWSDMTPHLVRYTQHPYYHPIKVVIDKQIAGIGTTVLHKDSAWLAHIIVHPQHRNKGLGKAITNALIDSIDEAHNKSIYLIATDLGYAVYSKLGFEVEEIYTHRERNQGAISTTISNAIIPYQEKYKRQILALDRMVSGEEREDRLNEGLEGGYVLLENKKVEGAYFPQMGDGLIIAENDSAGIELMKLRMQTKANAILPNSNLAGKNFLEQNEFREIRTSRRMVLGRRREWQPQRLYNRISGQVG